MDDEDYKVSSEIYAEFDYTTSKKPTFNANNIVSEFKFIHPDKFSSQVDRDGDLIVRRKTKGNEDEFNAVLEIEHSSSTVLNLVGLQIWRGAFLLSDWLIHNAESIPKDSVILELGSGVGLTSIVAAMFSPVICTDVDRGDILKLIESNVAKNKEIINHPIKVLELDFMKTVLHPDIESALPNIAIIIAADVVYDDNITLAFIHTIQRLLSKPPARSVYVALEKRYVFTTADLDTSAPCYEYFLDCTKMLKNVSTTQVPLDFPKYFQYDRVKELVLWKITSNFK